jgi:dipeptidyl aminopeptidase/acylaminoacyl peptidase
MTRSIEPEDLFRFRFVTAADLSPDATKVVFAQTRIAPGEEEDDDEVEHTDLHLLDLESNEVRRLTFSDSTNSAPAISPDGSRVVFISTRKEKPQLWLLPLDGGEPRQLTDLPQGVGSGAVWSPDGSKIAFTAGPQEEPRKPEHPYRITRTVWRFDEIGVLDDAVQDVYVLDGADHDAEPLRLTEDRFMNSEPKWSADGQSLVYVASHDPDSYELMARLRRVDLEGTVTDLTGPDGLVASHALLSDGRVAYVLDFERDTPIGSRTSLYVLDPATGARTRRGADIEGHIDGGLQPDNPGSRIGAGQLLLTEDEREAIVRVQTGGEVALVRVALDGDESHSVVAGGTRACASIAVRGSRVLFAGFGFTEPGDLYLVDLDTGEERRLTRLNEDVLAELDPPTVVPLSFAGIDGVQVEGWFLQPSEAEGPLPTLLSIHGGPHGAWGAHFNFDHLMFAGAGYGVLLINHRA